LGIGRVVKSRRHGFASQRAQRVDRAARALSVAIPVFAYICRYSFEMNTKASFARVDLTHWARFQIKGRL
jgi:hypothetical protein